MRAIPVAHESIGKCHGSFPIFLIEREGLPSITIHGRASKVIVMVVHVADLEHESASFNRCFHLENIAELFVVECIPRMSKINARGSKFEM